MFPPFNLPGSKVRLSRQLTPPPHRRYIEACAGGAAFLFSKPRSPIECLYDLDPVIINAHLQIRDNLPRLTQLLRLTPFSREIWERAWERKYEEEYDVYGALSFLILNRMSNLGFGFQFDPRREGRWAATVDRITECSQRLQGVEIALRDALTVFGYQRRHTFIFVDPPYLPTKRTLNWIYRYEMTLNQHLTLLDKVARSKAQILLCGYDSTIYDRRLPAWSKRQYELAHLASPKGGTRIETTWSNYD